MSQPDRNQSLSRSRRWCPWAPARPGYIALSLLSCACGIWLEGTAVHDALPRQAEAQETTRRPLDLPAGFRGRNQEHEDESESIVFYGEDFEADGFFWCLDTSGSMAEGGKLAVLKQEVTRAIHSLSHRAEFGLVSFNSGTQVWSQQPVPATAEQKALASSWVQSLIAQGWTCLAPAAVQTLEISQQSRRRSKAVLIVGDGVPICNGVDTSAACRLAVSTANWERTPVHTLYVANDNEGQAFMRQLAEENGGQFVPVGG